MSPSKKHRLSTLALHGGRELGTDDPVVTPLVQSVNHVLEAGRASGLRYPRYGNSPNAELVQRRLALLEGAEEALLLSSGQAATACALFALLRPGDHLLASSWIYGGTRELLMTELSPLGIEVTLVDPMELRGWRKHMRKNTRAIFLESPVNPTCRVVDIAPIRYLTKENGLALVVDSTFASPVLFRPIDFGADVVIQSATKFLNGHHDVLGGVVYGTAPYIEEVRQKMIMWGQAPDPFAVWLLERGLKTLAVRVERQSATALQIAEWAVGRKGIRAVHYPGLHSHVDHAIANKQQSGFGAMVGLEMVGGARGAEKFIRRLSLIAHAPSLGGVDSLVSEPRLTSHAHLSAAERVAAGIPDGFVRLSVGLEDPADLIADLETALK